MLVLPVPVNANDFSLMTNPVLPATILPVPLFTLKAYVPSAVPVPPLIVPAVTSEFVVLMVTSENNWVVLNEPFRSTAPVVVMLPLSLLIPVP